MSYRYAFFNELVEVIERPERSIDWANETGRSPISIRRNQAFRVSTVAPASIIVRRDGRLRQLGSWWNLRYPPASPRARRG